MASGKGEIDERGPGFAVVVRDGFDAVVPEAGVFAHEGDEPAAAEGEDRDFAELVAFVVGHEDLVAPRLTAVVGEAAELGEVTFDGVVGGYDPASGVEFEEFVGDDAAKRGHRIKI